MSTSLRLWVSFDLIASDVLVVVIEPVGSKTFYSLMALNIPWKKMSRVIERVAKDMEVIGEKIVHEGIVRFGSVVYACAGRDDDDSGRFFCR